MSKESDRLSVYKVKKGYQIYRGPYGLIALVHGFDVKPRGIITLYKRCCCYDFDIYQAIEDYKIRERRSMIKYPVSYAVNKFGLGHFVVDKNYVYVAEVNNEREANTIVRALNAMNEFPVERTQIALRFLRKYSTSVYNWVYKWFSTEGE